MSIISNLLKGNSEGSSSMFVMYSDNKLFRHIVSKSNYYFPLFWEIQLMIVVKNSLLLVYTDIFVITIMAAYFFLKEISILSPNLDLVNSDDMPAYARYNALIKLKVDSNFAYKLFNTGYSLYELKKVTSDAKARLDRYLISLAGCFIFALYISPALYMTDPDSIFTKNNQPFILVVSCIFLYYVVRKKLPKIMLRGVHILFNIFLILNLFYAGKYLILGN